MMLFVLNRYYNKNSFKCLVTFVSSLELPFLVRTTCFHLVNGSLIFRLGNLKASRLDAHYWGLEESFKFMTTLQRTKED